MRPRTIRSPPTPAQACAHTKNRHLPGEHGILSSYVVGVVLVDGEGRIHRVTETTHGIQDSRLDRSQVDAMYGPPDVFMRHIRSSHGMLGVICEVIGAQLRMPSYRRVLRPCLRARLPFCANFIVPSSL